MKFEICNLKLPFYDMVWIKDGSLCKDTRFNDIPGVIQFTTTREEGNLKNGTARKKFTQKYGFSGWALCEQVHGNGIADVSQPFKGEKIFPHVDGLICRHASIALGVFTADCVPVFFIDPGARVIAVAHAGWRGVHAGIVSRVLEQMTCGRGSDSRNILVSLGPHIHACCYTVGEEVRRNFTCVQQDTLNMEKEIIQQAVDTGVQREHIISSSWCTAHETDIFFSYRKENGTANRMFSVIGIL